MVVDLLAGRLGAGRFVNRYGGRFVETRGPVGPLALLIPTTFMNNSGDAIGPAAGSLHAAPEQVLVVHDELDLPFGTVRGKLGGGHGGHNGLRSLCEHLGPGFLRVRCGVGRPGGGEQVGRDRVVGHVLGPFSRAEQKELPQLIEAAADAVEALLTEGPVAAMNRFNRAAPQEDP